MCSGVRKLGWPTSSRTVPCLVMAMLEISRMPEWAISAGSAERWGRGLRMRLGYCGRRRHRLAAEPNSEPDRPAGVEQATDEEAGQDEGGEGEDHAQPVNEEEHAGGD